MLTVALQTKGEGTKNRKTICLRQSEVLGDRSGDKQPLSTEPEYRLFSTVQGEARDWCDTAQSHPSQVPPHLDAQLSVPLSDRRIARTALRVGESFLRTK